MSILSFLFLFGLVVLVLLLATLAFSKSELFSKIISKITPGSHSRDDRGRFN